MSAVAASSKNIVDWLIPTQLPDHEAARGSRLVVRVALITLGVCLLMQVKYYAEHAYLIATMTWVSIALQVLGMVLHRVTGSYRVGAHLFCFSLWALFFGIAQLSGGIDSPNMVANLFIVVLAPMMLGRRHGLIWLGGVGVNYVTQFLLTSRGMVQQTLPLADLPATRLAELIATSVTVGLTAYYFAKGQERMRGQLAREKQLVDVANGDLRVILDNSGQGFLSLDAQGKLTGERSAIINSWLKGAQVGDSFWSLLATLDPPIAERFRMGWSELESEVLPLDLYLDQLPKGLVMGETTLSLAYRPVPANSEKFEKLVVILSDVSAEVAREKAEARQRDLLQAFERILHDPEGFCIYLESARRDVQAISSGALVDAELKRCLHTFKGNSAMIGLSALAQVCHQLESELAKEKSLNPVSIKSLEREFATVEERLGSFVTTDESDISLRASEYETFLRDLSARKPHQELARTARSWSQRRVDRQLSRLAEYARQLSLRLGKGPLDLQVKDNDVRVAEGFADFWSVAVHLVRNALDHGIEQPEERTQSGKGPGVLELKAGSESGLTVFEIKDDGRGIDWQKLRELAKARGLPVESEQDLLAALLSDGLSTSDQVSETSGRGVGMGSVRKVCANLGITINVQSKPGAGTAFRFVFPAQPLDAAAHANLASA